MISGLIKARSPLIGSCQGRGKCYLLKPRPRPFDYSGYHKNRIYRLVFTGDGVGVGVVSGVRKVLFSFDSAYDSDAYDPVTD